MEDHEVIQALATATLDVVDVMLLITDRDGCIVYVNPAFTRVTGYAPEEALGQKPSLLRSGMQDDRFYDQLWERVLHDGAWSGELINRKKSGELYTDRMTITALRDADGDVTHFVAVKRDVGDHLAALTAGSPGGLAHTDSNGRLVYANGRLSALLGRSYEELLGTGWLDALGPRVATRVLADLAEVATGTSRVSTLELPDGRSLRFHYAPLLLDETGQVGVIASLEDVTAERDAVRQIKQREAYARAILESLGTATAVVDGEGVVREVSRAWRDNTGVAGAELASVPIGMDYAQACRQRRAAGCTESERVLDALDSVLSGRSSLVTLDYSLDAARAIWWELRVSSLELDQGGAVLTNTDVTRHHEVQRLLEEQARTDPLTGLANRNGLLAFGAGAMARARRTKHPVTVIFIDLDSFKPINDLYGHQAGDEVLRRCAERLVEVVRETDGIARVGGDEFVVVCETLSDAYLGPLVTRIGQALAEPTRLECGTEVSVTASMGTVQVDGSADLARAIADADERMYVAKRQRLSAR